MSILVAEGLGPLPGFLAALEARLRTVFPASRFALDIVPAGMTRDHWLRVAQRLPFIGIGWGEITLDDRSAVPPKGSVGWSIYLVTGGQTARARLVGDATGPGLLDVATIATLALHGWGAEAGTVMVKKVSHLTGNLLPDNLAVAGLTLDLPVLLAAEGADAALEIIQDSGSLDIAWGFVPPPETGES